MRVLPIILSALASASGIAGVSASPAGSPLDAPAARDVASASSSSQAHHARSDNVNGLFHLSNRRRRFSQGGAGVVDHEGHTVERAASMRRRRNRKRSGSCAAKTTSTSSKPTSTTKATSSSTTKATSSSTTKAATTSTTTKATSSTKTTSTTAQATSTASSSSMIMGGYWPSWVSDTLPATSIDWAKFDYVAFAFAVPSTTGTIPLDSDTASLLKGFVTAAHAKGKKALCSLGGWGQSNGFSPSVSTDALQQTFANNILAFIKKYNLDGIDLDWEYPNSAYAGNYDASDAKNWQTFLGVLRTTLGTSYMITTATSQAPWISSTGGTVTNVARAAAALDYIMIMNYDVWGVSSTPGANAPLADLCGNSSQPGANAAAAVKQWGDAGMPRSKMILGVPFYGYVSNSAKYYLSDRRRSLPESSEDVAAMPRTEAEKRATSLSEGSINFSDIISNSVLSRSSATSFVATKSAGFTRYWDSCSDSPYLANGKQVITYDDPVSLYDKAAFAAEAGLGGCAAWSLDGDTTTWDLTAAMLSGMGK